MGEHVVTVSYGREASEVLAATILRAQNGSLLAPVTVIVPSNFAGLTARRLLGVGIVGRGGIANVGFLTPFRLADLMAADQLFATRPITNPVLGAAVRKALADDPGPFAAVAAHEATEAALASLYGELSNVSPAALERMRSEGGRAAATAVRMYRSIATHLEGFHGEADVARAAAHRADLAEVLRPFGAVIWYLPAPTTAPMAELVGAVLAGAGDATVIVGLTHDQDADAPVWATCARAGIHPSSEIAARPPITADHIVSTTDADEEVRAVLRDVVRLAESGVALDRIGIFFPTPEPYLAIIAEQVDAAGLPANGPSPRRLADSAAGRTLLGALDLPRLQWRRDRVLKLISGAPVRSTDGVARPTAWDMLSRRAGVVADLSDWQIKLAHLRADLEAYCAGANSETEAAKIRHVTDDLADLDQLDRFVSDLAATVSAVEAAPTWATKTEQSKALLHQLLGAGHRHAHWPEHEQAAFERVEDALTRLATLDDLEPVPHHAVFLRALAAELAPATGRAGQFGRGVTYGPLSSAAGHDLDAVFVLGCVEGLCPSPRREDAMLPDSARVLTDGELEPGSLRLRDQHRSFLAALASAPTGRRTLSAPRGDLRGGRTQLPSRWLLESASALAGEPVFASDFATQPTAVIDAVPSFASGLLASATFTSIDERDLASVRRFQLRGGDISAHEATAPIARGLHLQAARRSSAFTEWDGNLAGQPIPSTADRPMSATRLQNWASCGFQYFLRDVLRLGEREDPERLIELSALDRGSAVHEVLERFIREAIADGAPEPDEPWTAAQRERLLEIAAEVATELEARGRTGRPLNWRLAKQDLFDLLADFLVEDDEYRRDSRSRPIAVELPFGFEDIDPVRLVLADGRTLSFRGYADRVDRRDDGHLLVSDYKTGKGAGYVGIHEGDPVKAGTLLQLGLYAEAANEQLGGPEATTEAHYWMIDPRVAFAQHGYPWTPERRARFLDVVTAIADGVEGGVFPAVPGEWDSFRNTHTGCTYCAFDTVCPRGRGEQATAKVADPQLRVRDALAFEVSP